MSSLPSQNQSSMDPNLTLKDLLEQSKQIDDSLPHLMIAGIYSSDQTSLYLSLTRHFHDESVFHYPKFCWSKVKLTTAPHEMIISCMNTTKSEEVLKILSQHQPHAVVVTADNINNTSYLDYMSYILRMTTCPILSVVGKCDSVLACTVVYPQTADSTADKLMFDFSSPIYNPNTVQILTNHVGHMVEEVRGFKQMSDVSDPFDPLCRILKPSKRVLFQAGIIVLFHENVMRGLIKTFPELVSRLMDPKQILNWVFDNIKVDVGLNSANCQIMYPVEHEVDPDGDC